jgi:excisionase family DNA binding protein
MTTSPSSFGEDERVAVLRARCYAAERAAAELADLVRRLGREATELAERPVAKPKAVSVQEAARLLALSRTSLYELLDAGRIRSVKVGSRRLIPAVALDDFLTGPDRADTPED